VESEDEENELLKESDDELFASLAYKNVNVQSIHFVNTVNTCLKLNTKLTILTEATI